MIYFDRDHHNIVSLLIDRGANIHSINQNGQTPLHICSIYGHIHSMHYLMKNDIRMVMDKNGFTPFHHSVGNEQIICTYYMISKGVNVDIIDRDQRTGYKLIINLISYRFTLGI